MTERKKEPARCIEDELGPFDRATELTLGPDNIIAAKVGDYLTLGTIKILSINFTINQNI